MCAVLLALNIAFIWGNSLLPGDMSGALSAWVGRLLAVFGDDGALQEGHGLLRKLAHFSEFACLGVLLCLHGAAFGKKPRLALLCGFLIACTDELIQCFVPERGPAVRDVAIDTAGITVGIILYLAGHTIYRNKKHLEEPKT